MDRPFNLEYGVPCVTEIAKHIVTGFSHNLFTWRKDEKKNPLSPPSSIDARPQV
jgi:hypothetical protein